jgi:Na+-transporting NADH:ubiquinone oxidoreductase subunit NqrC
LRIEGIDDEEKMAAMNKRGKEVVELSKMFYDLSKEISGIDVLPNAEITCDGVNDHLTFTVTSV